MNLFLIGQSTNKKGRKFLATISQTLFLLLIVLANAITNASYGQQITRTFSQDDSPHRFHTNLTVPFGEVWKIEQGVHLCFDENVSFNVDGVLIATGTRERPIVLTSCKPTPTWAGMRFVDSRQLGSVRSSLKHVVIEAASKRSQSPAGHNPDTSGGALSVIRSDLDIFGATIRHNQADVGGGIYIGYDSDVTIDHSTIYGNTALGSRYIFAGGGGIYADGPRRLRILRSIVAQNRFHSNNYSNEEGGGGIYISGGNVELGFNLIVGNSSGKGSGMLVMGNSRNPHVFAANIFAYNVGSTHLEQVALQTRYSFTPLQRIPHWATNIGQAPFVAHLNRNTLAQRYLVKGSTEFLRALQVGSAVDVISHFQDKVTDQTLAGMISRKPDWPMCGSAYELGPIEICDQRGRSMEGYFTLLGELYDKELGDLLSRQYIYGGTKNALGDDDRMRLGQLISPAPKPNRPGEVPPDPIDSRLVDLVFGNSTERREAAFSIVKKNSRRPRRGEMTSLLMVSALGQIESFDILTTHLKGSLPFIQNAIEHGHEKVALSLIRRDRYSPELSRKSLHEILQWASAKNLTRIVKEILDKGVNPNIVLRNQLPLAIAVSNGHLDTVQLLLLRGADPNARVKMSSSDSRTFPILAFALDWYHLGSGWHEVAELLVAAGATLDLQDLPDRVHSDALELKSAVQLGIAPPTVAAEFAVQINPVQSWQGRVRQELVDHTVSVDPTIENIRELRSSSVDNLAFALADDVRDNATRTAAARILSVRPFELTGAVKRNLLLAAETQSTDTGSRKFSLERILRFPRSPSARGAQSLVSAQPRSHTAGLLPYGNRYAIILGVSDYEHLLSREDARDANLPYDLRYAALDAEAMVDLIKSGRLGNEWRIESRVGNNATKDEVQGIMSRLEGEVQEDDLVLFYFAGHGFTAADFDDGRNFFFLYDSELDNMADSAVPFAEVREWLQRVKSRHALLILDTCHSGTIGTARGGWSSSDYAELSDRRAHQEAGKIAITSSMGWQLSHESDERQLGYFTAALIDVLSSGSEVDNQGRFVMVEDFYERVRAKVIQTAPPSQIPSYVLLDGDDLLDFPIAFAY